MVGGMSIEQFREAVPTILDAYFTAFKSSHRVGETFRKVSMHQVARQLLLNNLISFESASVRMQALIEELQDYGQYDDLSVNWYKWSRSRHTGLLSDVGEIQDEEDEVALVPLSVYMHKGRPKFTYDKIRRNIDAIVYYVQKGKSLEAVGRAGEATLYYVASYVWSRLGDDHQFRARTAVDLELHYRRKGDIESAERIRDEFTSNLVALVQ